MIEVMIAGRNCPINVVNFPTGENLPRIEFANPTVVAPGKFTVRFHYEDDREFFLLAQIVSVIRQERPGYDIDLFMPYLPHARQDRVTQEGEALSVKVVASIINSLNFSQVEIWDCHSNVGLALIDRVRHRDMTHCAGFVGGSFDKESTLLVSPDAGATKKLQAFAKRYGFNDPIAAEKKRDSATGAITGTYVPRIPIWAKNILIMDDICDGGRTFTELAKAIKVAGPYSIGLYVTHAIMSKGFEPFEGLIDTIYYRNWMNRQIKPEPPRFSDLRVIGV